MLAAFRIFNLQPGPELFTNNSDLVWTLIASLYSGNIMLLRRAVEVFVMRAAG
jgi:putative tricarboxylic transport membrane protein